MNEVVGHLKYYTKIFFSFSYLVLEVWIYMYTYIIAFAYIYISIHIVEIIYLPTNLSVYLPIYLFFSVLKVKSKQRHLANKKILLQISKEEKNIFD